MKNTYAPGERELQEALGAVLRSARKGLGLSLETVAEQTSVDHTSLSRIERGQLGLRATRLIHIADALGLSVEDVVDAARSKA